MVLEMWRNELTQRGIEFKNPEAPIEDKHLPRSEAKEAPVEIVQGEERQLRYEFRKYNYVADRPEPVGLTGSGLTWTVYKLPETISMHLSNPDLGVEVDIDIPVSEEQAAEYVRLGEKQEGSTFALSLIEKDPALQKLVEECVVRAIRDASALED